MKDLKTELVLAAAIILGISTVFYINKEPKIEQIETPKIEIVKEDTNVQIQIII